MINECPSCGRVGEPQHDVDGVTVYVCGHPEDCDYDETWEVPRRSTKEQLLAAAKAALHALETPGDFDGDGLDDVIAELTEAIEAEDPDYFE